MGCPSIRGPRERAGRPDVGVFGRIGFLGVQELGLKLEPRKEPCGDPDCGPGRTFAHGELTGQPLDGAGSGFALGGCGGFSSTLVQRANVTRKGPPLEAGDGAERVLLSTHEGLRNPARVKPAMRMVHRDHAAGINRSWVHRIAFLFRETLLITVVDSRASRNRLPRR
jgi:hypothetical protein